MARWPYLAETRSGQDASYDDGVTPPGYSSSQDWWTGYTWVKRDHWTAL